MPTCFVIQPFDTKYHKRYDDVYKPALHKAGLEAYRIDQDPSTERLIDSIEEEISKATICLADITTDNPNVWYELGYAFAVGRSVIMVCSTERTGKLPFDIQHRTVIKYSPESASDFERLSDEISTRAKALVQKNAELQVIEAQQVAPTSGLRQHEILVLAAAVAETKFPGQPFNAWSLRHEAKNAGLNETGVTIAFRGLQHKRFLEFGRNEDDFGGLQDIATVTDTAWAWIDSNDSRFSLFKRRKNDDVDLTEDDIPF